MTIEITQLFSVQTASQIFKLGLEVAQALGLPVTSWRTGDPTRSLYKYLATVLANLETQNSEYIRAGFLSTAEGDWLTVLASEVYGVDRVEATYATPTITVHNTGGGFYPIEPNDLTFKDSASGKTYHNTSKPIVSGIEVDAIASGQVAVFALEADEAGSASNVSANDVDTLVTTKDGVEVVSSTAAVASDDQPDSDLKIQCRATLGALSPNGPADAYEYVCKNPALTGTDEITRAKSSGDRTNGHVLVYVAGSAGAVSGAAVILAQAAVEEWATPLCVTPTVSAAAGVFVDVTATISGTDIPADFLDRITAALDKLFATYNMGQTVARSAIIAAIHNAISQIGSVTLTVPAADITMAGNNFPVTGTVGVTEA